MFCPNCGSHMSDDAKFCSVCGAVLPTVDTPQQQASEPKTPTSETKTPFGAAYESKPQVNNQVDNSPFGAAYENHPTQNYNQPDNSPFGAAYETPQSMQRYNNTPNNPPPYYNNNGNPYNGNGYNGNQYNYGNQYPPQQQTTDNNTLALVGFIMSFFVPIVGLILSILGLKNSKVSGKRKGLAIAGIIISGVTMVINFALIMSFGLNSYLDFLFGSYYNYI